MKKLFVIGAAILSAAHVIAATVENVSFRQNWPWSTDIKINYTITGEDTPVDVKVEFFDGETALTPLTHNALTGDIYAVGAGTHTIRLDTVRAFGTSRIAYSAFKVRITAAASASNLDEKLYKIFQLSDGACTDVTRADILNGKYGDYETDYSKIGKGFTTAAADVLIWTAVTNDVKYKTTHLVMRKISAANKTWHSGDPDGYLKNNFPSAPRAWIQLSYDYYIGVFEVTLEQYKRIYGSYPANCATGPAGMEYLVPANMSYYYLIIGYTMSDYSSFNTVVSNQKLFFPNNTYVRDVGKESYCHKMWKKTKCEFTLPTQAEWEYASRGGTDAALYSGEAQTSANVEKLAWTSADGAKVHVVGTKLPNAYGLYDTLGNAIERTLSQGAMTDGATSGTGATADDPAIDPIGATTTKRDQVGYSYGGGCLSDAGNWMDCRSGARSGWMDYGNARTDSGFRVVMPARADGQWADHPSK